MFLNVSYKDIGSFHVLYDLTMRTMNCDQYTASLYFQPVVRDDNLFIFNFSFC